MGRESDYLNEGFLCSPQSLPSCKFRLCMPRHFLPHFSQSIIKNNANIRSYIYVFTHTMIPTHQVISSQANFLKFILTYFTLSLLPKYFLGKTVYIFLVFSIRFSCPNYYQCSSRMENKAWTSTRKLTKRSSKMTMPCLTYVQEVGPICSNSFESRTNVS
jgi:hypothetical protein